MRSSKATFVTSCQQLLALGAVLAVLTPAASVISLDVVRTPGPVATGDGSAASESAPHQLPAADRGGRRDEQRRPDGGAAAEESVVPVVPVDATVEEVPLTAAVPEERTSPREGRAGRDRAVTPARRVETVRSTRTEVVSEPQPVEGYGAVGVTWSSGDPVDEDEIRVQVRTLQDGTWSGWLDVEYHGEHAPDPSSEEAGRERPGTDPLLVGTVDRVQARVVAETGLPSDLSLAVVAPGEADAETEQAPAFRPGGAGEQTDPGSEGEEGIELQAADSEAPKPRIFTRKQWGANERLRDGRPSYGTIRAGFVHHTVNANGYSRSDVPGILRSIYAYHTQSRGWSDIGYNFLVDKFGRIWEGRAGGMARPVIGAHTYGYNHESFAMSAIGNFETARPSDAMLRAYGDLFAWKLGLHGVDPLDRSQRVGGSTFRAINGHRDAGSTACPGRYLYAKLPAIRQYAAAAGDQDEVPEIVVEQVDSDLAGTKYPDLVVRRAGDGRGMILPTGGLSRFLSPTTVVKRWGARRTLAVPDMTGDGRVDVVTFDDTGALEVRPGLDEGGFGPVARTVRSFRGHGVVASVGDLDGDARPDFVGRRKGRLVMFLGRRNGGFRRVSTEIGVRRYRQLVGAGDVTGDGRPDLWGRDRRGRVFLHRGRAEADFGGRRRVAGAEYAWLAGGVDYTGDGIPDLIARNPRGSLLLVPSRGDGTLGRAVGPVADAGLSSVSGAGQLVGNEAPDLLATNAAGDLVVARNRGTFDLGRALDTGQSFAHANLLLNAGDFTGDGHGDVILRRRNGALQLYRGNGAGRLSAPSRIGGKRAFRKVSDLRVTADVTGDGAHDLVGRSVDGDSVVWPGNGAETLGSPYVVKASDPAPRLARSAYDWSVPVSDLRRRGVSDLVVRDHDGLVYRLNGKRRGYGQPRYLGEATGFDLGG